MESLASKKIENLWAKQSLSSWTEAANAGLLAIFESVVYFFGPGFLVPTLGRGLSQPISSQRKNPNIPSSKCLHSILPCVSVPADWNSTRYLGDATEGRGNTVSWQPTLDESKQRPG